jgi:hypothetical protein
MGRVVEYLCTNPDCKSPSQWHAFDMEAMALEHPGEYTVTLRVRELEKKPARTSSGESVHANAAWLRQPACKPS